MGRKGTREVNEILPISKKIWWDTSNLQKKLGKRGKRLPKSVETLVLPLWRAAGSGAKAPPLDARPKQRFLEKNPGQLGASFLIFLTLGSVKQKTRRLSRELIHLG